MYKSVDTHIHGLFRTFLVEFCNWFFFCLLSVMYIQLHMSYLLVFIYTYTRYFIIAVIILGTEMSLWKTMYSLLLKYENRKSTIYPFTIWPRFETAAACDISNTGISTCFLIYVTAWSTYIIAFLSSYFFLHSWMHSLLNLLPDDSSFHRLCLCEWERKSKSLSLWLSFIPRIVLLVLFLFLLSVFYLFLLSFLPL